MNPLFKTFIRLEELTWTRLQKMLKTDPDLIAILPIGSTEQHGFGPLGTDYYVAKLVAERLAELTNSVLCPTMPYGMAYHHTAYPGTISLGMPAFVAAAITELLYSIYRSGFRRCVVVNGHGGNKLSIKNAIASVQVTCQDFRVLANNLDYLDGTKPELSPANAIMAEIAVASGEAENSHADAAEFSILQALMPEVVEMMDEDLADQPELPDNTRVTGIRDPKVWQETLAIGRGGKGDPRRANVDLGWKFIEAYLDQLVRDCAEKLPTVTIEKPGWKPGTHEGAITDVAWNGQPTGLGKPGQNEGGSTDVNWAERLRELGKPPTKP